MSEYTVVETEIADQELIKEALEEMGYAYEQATAGTKINLMGYMGDRRKQVADIVIRKKNVGTASNDIGFNLGKNGKYEIIISEYDQRAHRDFVPNFNKNYVQKTSEKQLRKKGYKLKKKNIEKDGWVELRFG